RVDVQPQAGGDGGREPALQIAVSDTGIGISAEQQKKLFVAYRQSEAWIARQFGGTGLGLAISRELALKLGGDIAVVSTPGVGSTFAVRVAIRPLRPLAGRTSHPPVARKVLSSGAEIHGKLLLADDSPDNRRIIATLLFQA